MQVDQLPKGVELETTEEGWAVYGGSEGDNAYFVAFFLREDTAQSFAQAKHPDPDEGTLVFDPCVTLALRTPVGIISANDYTVKNHEQLKARLAEASCDLRD